MQRLKTTEVATYRARLYEQQQGKCALCGFPMAKTEAVLDHDHTTGVCRAVLHRGCNAMLGHIENNAPRNHLTDPVKMARFLGAITSYKACYLPHLVGALPLHPTHRTDEEKRLLRNKRARIARKKAKE